MRLLQILILFLILGFMTSANVANAMEALRDAKGLWEAKTETVVRVSSAKVIAADYELIRKDFPELRNFSPQSIDNWLIRNTAFISLPQAKQSIVNETIPTTTETRSAFRPREYRRAHVFAADTGGLIDAKGTGAVDPSVGNHDNGLATLGDMIREYAFEKLIHALFQKDGRFDTVGSYGVIDYGFNIKNPDGSHSLAGTVLRQAHARYHQGKIGVRSRNQPTMLPRELQLKIEFYLRKFGITSAVKFEGKDLVNLQGSESLAVIDFGSFLVEEKFSNEVAFFYDAYGNGYGGEPIASPRDKNFLQPTPQLQIPFNIWGYSQSGKADSKYDNIYIWSHELAEALGNGHATRADVDRHLQNLFDNAHLQNILREMPRACEKIF